MGENSNYFILRIMNCNLGGDGMEEHLLDIRRQQTRKLIIPCFSLYTQKNCAEGLISNLWHSWEVVENTGDENLLKGSQATKGKKRNRRVRPCSPFSICFQTAMIWVRFMQHTFPTVWCYATTGSETCQSIDCEINPLWQWAKISLLFSSQ